MQSVCCQTAIKLGLLSPFVEQGGEVGDYRGRQATGFVFSQEDGDRLSGGFDFSLVFISCWGFVAWEIERGIGVIGLGFVAVESVSDRVDGIGQIGGSNALGLETIFLKALEGFKDLL